MFPSEHESRYITHQHPKGGITPSRYDLALHEYVQKQNERRQTSGNQRAALLSASLIDWISSWVARLSSKHPAGGRAR